MELINKLFQRDLDKLKKEVESYSSDSGLWRVKGDVKNPGGNLCMHLTGNLRHFIGHILGETDFVRDREAEFGSKNIPVSELLSQIELTKSDLDKILPSLSTADLAKNYPIDLFGYPMTCEEFILHLYGHFNYHLGQVNYHRRMID